MNEPDKPNLWSAPNNTQLLRFLLLAACGWVFVQFIQFFYGVIAMFTTAAILAVLLNYPVSKLSQFIPRWLAITLIFLSSIAIIVTFVALLGLEIMTQGTGLLNTITDTVQSSDLPFERFLDKINFDKLIDVLTSGVGTGLGIASGVFSNTFIFIFVLVITVYMLIDGKQIWSACLQVVPLPIRDRVNMTVQKSFIGFFRAQLLLVLFLSISSFIVFSLLGVKFALVLSIVVAVLDAIPGIGATLGVIIATVLVFASQGSQMALQVVVASILLQQVQDNVISPKVMRRSLEINPIFLFLSIFIGEKLAGVLGIFLAIPIAGMIVSWVKTEHEKAQRLLKDRQ